MQNNESYSTYRVIASTPTEENISCSIYEVYYKNGVMNGWSDEPVRPMGANLVDLRAQMALFQRAFSLPMLIEIDGKLVPQETDPSVKHLMVKII